MPSEIQEVRKALSAFLDKHFETLRRSDAAFHIEEAIEALEADERFLQMEFNERLFVLSDEEIIAKQNRLTGRELI